MKKAWNVASVPVYSLVTRGIDSFNMNICTYVTAVSMQPKRMVVAVYRNTLSLENFDRVETAVLQLLHRDQYKLVKYLGQKSGYDYDKTAYLRRNHPLCEWQEHEVLRDSMAWMKLKKINRTDAGDHILFLCDVTKSCTLNQNRDEVLSTGYLSEKKIIRI